MKKTISRLLALCLAALLLMTCAAATYNVKQIDQADALTHLGLLFGTGHGYELEAKLNRSQSITLIVRMLGETAEADKGGYTHPFTDVPAWAEQTVAYAYQKGYINGYSANRFGGTDPVTDYQFLTMVLRALGYSDKGATPDFNYRKSAVLGQKLSLVSSTEDNTDFVRGDAVEIFWNAMSVKLKGSDLTLSERLIEQKVFTQAQFNTAMDYAKNGKPATDTSTGGSKGTTGGSTAAPDTNKKAEDVTWEEYEAMTGEQRQAHFEKFASPEAYLKWMTDAKAAYDKAHPTIDVGKDGTIDIGEIIGKN